MSVCVYNIYVSYINMHIHMQQLLKGSGNTQNL